MSFIFRVLLAKQPASQQSSAEAPPSSSPCALFDVYTSTTLPAALLTAVPMQSNIDHHLAEVALQVVGLRKSVSVSAGQFVVARFLLRVQEVELLVLSIVLCG